MDKIPLEYLLHIQIHFDVVNIQVVMTILSSS